MTTNFWATWSCWTRCPYYVFSSKFLKISFFLIFSHFFWCYLVFSHVFSFFPMFSHFSHFFSFYISSKNLPDPEPTWFKVVHYIWWTKPTSQKPKKQQSRSLKPKARNQKPTSPKPDAKTKIRKPEAKQPEAKHQENKKKPKKTNQPKQPSRNEHTGDFQCRQATHSSHCSSAGKPDTVEVQVPESQTLYRCRKARHCQKPLVPVPESQTLWKYSCRKARHSTSAGKPDTSALPQCRNRQTKGQHSLSTWQDAFLITFVSGVGGRGEAP